MSTEIVAYEPAHLDAVIDLSLRAWEPVFASIKEALDPQVYSAFYPDWREVQRADVTAACNASDHDTWVATIEGRLVGFVDVTRADEVLAEIHMLAVDPVFQGQGIGGQLIEYALERMRAAGAQVAMVQTGGDPGHAPA